MYACSTTFLKLNSTYSITWSHHYLWLHSLAVYTSHWHMEHRLHLCWSSNREATFPWKKCCSPIGLDDRSAWDTFVRHNLSGSQIIHLSVIWLWCLNYSIRIYSPNLMPPSKEDKGEKGLWFWCLTFWIQVRNDKARRYLTSMRKKQPVQFSQKFPNADPSALRLLERLLAFDPKDRPTAEEVILVLDYELLHSMFCHFSFIVISWLNINYKNICWNFLVWCFIRHLQIPILKGCLKLKGSHPVSQFRRWSLNLRDGGSQRRTYGN